MKIVDTSAYNVPRASKKRPGLMVKIAPGWKGEKRKNLWGRGGVPKLVLCETRVLYNPLIHVDH